MMVRLSAALAATLFLAMLGLSVHAAVGPPTGVWLSEDKRGAIEIYQCEDKLCGRLVWFDLPAGTDRRSIVDAHNPDAALRTRPLCRLTIMGNFAAAGANSWDHGWIYNPDNGATYHAEMSVVDISLLKVRGYVGIPLLGQTQTWTRAPSDLRSCSVG